MSSLRGIAAVATVVVVADQVSKAIIRRNYGPSAEEHARDVLGSVLRIEYVENTGVAFGMLRNGNGMLVLVGIMAVAVLGFMLRRHLVGSRWLPFAAGLVLGGALGNMIDRIWFGWVTDFIAVGPWPRFNLADSAVTVGVIIMLWRLLLAEQPRTSGDNEVWKR